MTAPHDSWDAVRVRRLRGYLGETQRQFADRLGTRQQTVSEWETGASRPRRMAQRLLHLLAEERGYYSARDERAEAGAPGDGAPGDAAAAQHPEPEP
jgi:transcriptional regulator with XRE-family HTH domain